jgi:hypothetical protein
MDGTYRTYVTYTGHRRKKPYPSGTAQESLFTCHLSPRSPFVQQDPIQRRGDTRLGSELGAPILRDGVDPQMRA